MERAGTFAPPSLDVLLRDDSCTLDDLFAELDHAFPGNVLQDDFLWTSSSLDGAAADPLGPAHDWGAEVIPNHEEGLGRRREAVGDRAQGQDTSGSSAEASAQNPSPSTGAPDRSVSTPNDWTATEADPVAGDGVASRKGGPRIRKRVREKQKIQMLERLLREKTQEAEALERANSGLRREAQFLEAALLTSQDMVDIAERVRAQVEQVTVENPPAVTLSETSQTLLTGPRVPLEFISNLSLPQLRGMMLGVIRVATTLLVDPSPQNHANMQRILENGHHLMLHLFVMKPSVVYQVETFNIATGAVEFPDNLHYARVAQALELSSEQQLHLDACFTLYQRLFSELLQARRQLVRLLPLTISEMVEEGVTTAVLANLRKEAFLYGMLNCSIVKSLTPLQWASLLVHSYPYKPVLTKVLGHALDRSGKPPQ